MLTVKNILFFTLGVSATVIPHRRDFSETSAEVLMGLKKLDADIITLGKDNEAFNSSNPASASAPASGVLVVESDLVLVSTTAKLSLNNFTESGAQAIIDYVKDPLVPDNDHTIATLEANKAAIIASGTLPIVQGQLAVLVASVNDMVHSIEIKTPSDKSKAISHALEEFQRGYDEAQKYFAS